jgi:hypothetical protein
LAFTGPFPNDSFSARTTSVEILAVTLWAWSCSCSCVPGSLIPGIVLWKR